MAGSIFSWSSPSGPQKGRTVRPPWGLWVNPRCVQGFSSTCAIALHLEGRPLHILQMPSQLLERQSKWNQGIEGALGVLRFFGMAFA